MITRYQAEQKLKTCTDWTQRTYLETIIDLWIMFADANADATELKDKVDALQQEKAR